MQIEILSSGTPDKVKVAIASQIKAAGASNPGAWPTLVSARDYIAHHVGIAGANDTVTVKAAITLEVGITPAQSTPALSVVPTPSAASYSIEWSGDNVSVSLDGGTAREPAPSPIIAERGETGAIYTFTASKGGRSASTSVVVPARLGN